MIRGRGALPPRQRPGRCGPTRPVRATTRHRSPVPAAAFGGEGGVGAWEGEGAGGTDHIGNLQLLCGSCNRIKGDRPQEYLVARLAEMVG